MKVLGMDTALGACSAAIEIDGTVIASHMALQARGHAETIMGQVRQVCAQAQMEVAEFDRLGVTTGPGTFTGQRVGLAAARAMVLGTGVQLIGVTTCQVVAAGVEGVGPEDHIFVVFDAKRSEVYIQGFDHHLGAITPPEVRSVPQAAARMIAVLPPASRVFIVGSGAALVRRDLESAGFQVPQTSASDQPDAQHVARLAGRAPAPGKGALPPAPLYLRVPDAKLPAKKRPEER